MIYEKRQHLAFLSLHRHSSHRVEFQTTAKLLVVRLLVLLQLLLLPVMLLPSKCTEGLLESLLTLPDGRDLRRLLLVRDHEEPRVLGSLGQDDDFSGFRDLLEVGYELSQPLESRS